VDARRTIEPGLELGEFAIFKIDLFQSELLVRDSLGLEGRAVAGVRQLRYFIHG